MPDIRQIVGKAGGGTDGAVVKQVFGVAVVILYRQANPVEESKVEPDIQVVVFLPAQVVVGHG